MNRAVPRADIGCTPMIKMASGPNAYSVVRFTNQELWDEYPARADEAICEALENGGFGEDEIRRKVGNYEGQIMAIRRGLVDSEEWSWRINDAGIEFLKRFHRPVPVFLPAVDDWHSRKGDPKKFEYCAFELERDGRPHLKLFKEAIPCGASWGMEPLLSKSDVVALRDYLNDWLLRKK